MNKLLAALVVLSLSLAPAARGAEILGPVFENPTGGIAFRPPAECMQVHKPGSENLADFTCAAKSWNLRVLRSDLARPMPLQTEKPGADGAPPRTGLVDMTVDQLTATSPDFQIMTQEFAAIAKRNVGLLIFRHTAGGEHVLTQQAMVQATERVYFILEMTSPGVKGGSSQTITDAKEKEAVDVFRLMLDTVKVLDRSSIREDQDQRLYRTRSLFVELVESRLRSSLVPQSYLRLIQGGKDIGYSYVVEEPFTSAGRDGFHIGIRSRTLPQPGTQVDAETWYFMTWDRRHEDWVNRITTTDAKEKSTVSEFGISNREYSRKLDPTAPRDPRDPRQPGVREIETVGVQVSTTSKGKRLPLIEKPLPPFYLPLAFSHLLSRLLPATEAKTYLFAIWASDRGGVLLRYIDVGKEEVTELADHPIRGIPVKDRLGLEGSVTTHYISREGKYLGSVNEDSKIIILPTTAQELQTLWKNAADLSRPGQLAPTPEK